MSTIRYSPHGMSTIRYSPHGMSTLKTEKALLTY
nr:MAG TPA: hypothetical protein [Herelleviridae sp.]